MLVLDPAALAATLDILEKVRTIAMPALDAAVAAMPESVSASLIDPIRIAIRHRVETIGLL